jgi:hypothetical protein
MVRTHGESASVAAGGGGGGVARIVWRVCVCAGDCANSANGVRGGITIVIVVRA